MIWEKKNNKHIVSTELTHIGITFAAFGNCDTYTRHRTKTEHCERRKTKMKSVETIKLFNGTVGAIEKKKLREREMSFLISSREPIFVVFWMIWPSATQHDAKNRKVASTLCTGTVSICKYFYWIFLREHLHFSTLSRSFSFLLVPTPFLYVTLSHKRVVRVCVGCQMFWVVELNECTHVNIVNVNIWIIKIAIEKASVRDRIVSKNQRAKNKTQSVESSESNVYESLNLNFFKNGCESFFHVVCCVWKVRNQQSNLYVFISCVCVLARVK